MSKQYWNGVLSRLPEFCQNMTKIGLTAAMVDQQQRCCRNTSIFPFAYGMMNNMGMGMGMSGADYWNMSGFMPGGCTQIPNMGNMGGYPMGMGGYPMGMGGYPTEMGAYPSMGMNNPILSFDNPSFTEGLRRIGENALNSLGTALGSKNTSNTGDKANATDGNDVASAKTGAKANAGDGNDVASAEAGAKGDDAKETPDTPAKAKGNDTALATAFLKHMKEQKKAGEDGTMDQAKFIEYYKSQVKPEGSKTIAAIEAEAKKAFENMDVDQNGKLDLAEATKTIMEKMQKMQKGEARKALENMYTDMLQAETSDKADLNEA